MNAAGLAKIDELIARKYSALQYQQSLIYMKNMGILLHCSQEIDQSTLLYFSVNSLPVGEKDYVVLLFSENSKPNLGQNSGQNLYERSYLYELVEEAVLEEFTGHYVFYPCQMDGRLVVLIHFVTGLLPSLTDSLLDMIGESCGHVIKACLETYDLHLSVHASGLTTLRHLASAYHQLLDEVTFYRFTDTDLSGQVTGLTAGDGPKSKDAFDALQSAPEQICAQISRGNDAAAEIDHLFTVLRWHPSRAIRSVLRELQTMLSETRRLLLAECIVPPEAFPEELCAQLIFSPASFEQLCADFKVQFARLARDRAARLQDAHAARMADVRKQADARLSDPTLSVAALAAENGMSPSALTGAFRRAYGITLLGYIQQRRLEAAEALLKQTDLPLRTICAQCGFGSLETMHRLFRNTLHMTPNQYRHVG